MNKHLLYEGRKIHYNTYGIGKPVFLIHGFGEDSAVWNNQVDFLKPKFKLIVPDLPGSGSSEMIDDMSMEGMAEVIHFIMHEETQNKNIKISESSEVPPSGGFRGAVIGHSMGGYITLALAEKYWNHIDAFGLIHSTAFADSEEKKAVRRKGIEFILKNGAFEFLKTATPNLFSEEFKDKEPVFLGEYISTLDNFSPDALVKYYKAMMQRPDRTAILKNTNVPVLFIMGKYDNAIPVNDGLKQCHLPGKTYFHILKHSGHMGMLEESAATNCVLEKFLLEN